MGQPPKPAAQEAADRIITRLEGRIAHLEATVADLQQALADEMKVHNANVVHKDEVIGNLESTVAQLREALRQIRGDANAYLRATGAEPSLVQLRDLADAALTQTPDDGGRE